MRARIKALLNFISKVIVLPCALLCWIEGLLFKDSESLFLFWGHIFSILPGLPGLFLRRAFYSLTLQRCSPNFIIGFGSIFTHRRAVVEDYVYIGIYALIGSAHLKKGSLIGSRASLLSGSALHERRPDGTWTPFDPSRMRQIKIGPNAWIGEGAIIMADVGEGSMVAAGSVVSTDIKPNIMVAGNPARFVIRLDPENRTED